MVSVIRGNPGDSVGRKTKVVVVAAIASVNRSVGQRLRNTPLLRHTPLLTSAAYHFKLYPAKEWFLREALKPIQDGRLPYPELIFSSPKKSGKTTITAMITPYTVLVVGVDMPKAMPWPRILSRLQDRIFQAVARIVEASPLLRQHPWLRSRVAHTPTRCRDGKFPCKRCRSDSLRGS